MKHKCKKTDPKTVEKCELNAKQIIKAMECCYDNTLSCIDCPFQEPDKYMECSGLTLSALALIKELTVENERLRAEGHWTSVKDKLPDNYRAVLVVCESTSISGGRLRAVGSYGGGCWSLADADGTMRLTKYMQYIVTHWMELPQLPKGE